MLRFAPGMESDEVARWRGWIPTGAFAASVAGQGVLPEGEEEGGVFILMEVEREGWRRL